MTINIVIAIGILVTIATCIPVFTQMRNHPKGLHILFFAEMWERFSYYGMRGLLIFYLTQHFLFDDKTAQGMYGSYTALVYLLPLVGGFLADKYLGTRKAIGFGALLLVAGHLIMGFHGPQATQQIQANGTAYNLIIEGRGDDRQVFIDAAGQKCALAPRDTSKFTCYGEIIVPPVPDGVIVENLPEAEQAQYAPDLAMRGLAAGSVFPAAIDNVETALMTPERSSMYTNILFLALALIVLGVGYLKANISSIVGQLYEAGDPRRDPGFTLYYFGINLGAFWASVLCGWLGQEYGWSWGFGLAAAGMAVGWLVFVNRRLLFFAPGAKQLPDNVGGPPDPEKLAAKVVGPFSLESLLYLLALPAVALVWFLIQSPELTGGALFLGLAVFGGYLIYFMVTKCNGREIRELILALVLITMSVVFWSLFEQAGSSLNQFADRNTDLSVSKADVMSFGPINFDMSISAAQTQSFNAGFILIFAPIFAALWTWLGARNLDPNTPLKFALALIQVGLGFLVLVWGANFADESYRVPLMFLVLMYLLHTTGELCISPVGLSMITKLSPAAVVSFMMAGWFLSSAFAQYVGGFIAQFTAAETAGGQVLDPAKALATYVEVFKSLGWLAIGIGVGLGLLSFLLKRLGHGKAGRIGGKDEIAAPAE